MRTGLLAAVGDLVRAGGTRREADGVARVQVLLHLPISAARRSAGRPSSTSSHSSEPNSK